MSHARILTAPEFRDALENALLSSKSEVLIVSGFVTSSAVQWLSDRVPPGINVSLVARWKYGDLASGASDFDAYWEARTHGYRFYVDCRLHTKAYLFDYENVFIGSANFTSNGLWLSGNGNQEHVTSIKPEIHDLKKLDIIVQQSTELNDDLVRAMEGVMDNLARNECGWPQEILDSLKKPVEGLWVSDLPTVSPVNMVFRTAGDDLIKQDLRLFSLAENVLSRDTLIPAFLETKIYSWTRRTVAEEGEVRFGHFSAALHQALLDDPGPYRRRVKDCVRVLFDWVDFMGGPEMQIVSHRRTQSIRWLGGPM